MREVLCLLILAFLCQSCFAYKTIDTNKDNLAVEKKYRIKLKDECLKADLVAINDSTLTVLYHNKNKEIRIADIRKMEEMKFSWTKTILYPGGIFAAALLVFFVGLAATW